MKKATPSFPSWHSSSKMWEVEKHFPQECQNGDFIKKMKIFSAVCWLLQLRRESNLYCLWPLDYYEKLSNYPHVLWLCIFCLPHQPDTHQAFVGIFALNSSALFDSSVLFLVQAIISFHIIKCKVFMYYVDKINSAKKFRSFKYIV